MIGQPLTVSRALLGGQQSLLPQSPFDVRPDYTTPGIGDGLNQPEEFFTWDAGGSKLSPDDLARRRQQADALTAGGMDYSPIASPWQGLSRVAQALMGAYDNRQLDKEDEANAAYTQTVAQALAGGGDNKALLSAALTDPRLSNLAPFAKLEYERQFPKPVNNDTAADYAFYEQMLGPGSGNTFLQNKLDPIVTIPLPGGQTYVGPRSGISSAQGGGGPTSGTPGASMPPQSPGNAMPNGSPLDGWPPPEAIRDLQRNPGSASQFDEVFGSGMAASILGR